MSVYVRPQAALVVCLYNGSAYVLCIIARIVIYTHARVYVHAYSILV